MTEWTRKLGFVIPSWNTVIEYETARMVPPGISLHFSRVTHTDDSEASLRHMGEKLSEHVELLSHAKVDATCYACTAASFLDGRPHEADHLRAVQKTSANPLVSMAGAIVDAAEHLGLRKVAVAAPYEQWLLDRLVRYLAEAGFTVTRVVGLGQQANILHTPQRAIELGLEAWSPDADGLILSCSNFRTLEVIPELERRLGKPVLTSNNSAMWKMLEVVGWRGVVPDAGVLLSPGATRPRAVAVS